MRCEEYFLREKKEASRSVFLFSVVSIIFSAKTHHRKHHTTKARLKFTKDDDEIDDGFVEQKEEFLLL